MAKFTITIDDALVPGITAAREAYNASLQPVRDEAGEITGPSPDTLDTDDAYVQFVMGRACESYAKQYDTDPVALDAKIDELQAKRAELGGSPRMARAVASKAKVNTKKKK